MAVAKKDDAAKGTEAAEEQVQDAVDEETEQGYRGVKVDQTPDEHYTATGDASKTPEAQADPVQARRDATNS